MNTVEKNTSSALPKTTTDSANGNESTSEASNQTAVSDCSKTSEVCPQSSSSLKAINSSVLENVPTASSQSAAQNNLTCATPNTVQSTSQLQNTDVKTYNSKFTVDNKKKPENNMPAGSKIPSQPPKTNTSVMNSQQPISADTKIQTTTVKGPSVNEPTKSIDLSSLSAVLEDGKAKEENTTAMPNETIDSIAASSSEHKPQNTSITFFSLYYIIILFIKL